jgi:Holliday junction resolvase RusA-like endonuclease
VVIIEFQVLGEPVGQPRARACAVKAKKRPAKKVALRRRGAREWTARVYDDDSGKIAVWRRKIAWSARRVRPAGRLLGAVRVDITWVFPRPQYMTAKKYGAGRVPYLAKPDRDNLDKAVLDELTRVGFWKDDAQAYGGTLLKFYAAVGEKAGAWVRIESLSD